MKDVQTDLVFTPLPKDYVPRLWSEIARVLKKSVETSDGKYQVDDLLELALNDELVLWVVLDPAKDDEVIAALTTRLIRYPQRNGMAMDWVGGTRMREWLPMAHPVMIDYAKDHNCWHMEGFGRKGWGRMLEKYGWKPDYTVYKVLCVRDVD